MQTPLEKEIINVVINYIKILLRGIGQVMLQENALTGIFFLIGIFYNSWLFGLGAIIGNIVSTLTSKVLKYQKEDIEKGLYGFNGTLVGIAVFYFYGLNLISLLYLLVGAIFSSIIMYYLNKKVPALTAPFVLTTWLIILEISIFKFIPLLSNSISLENSFNFFSTTTQGFGQVMFQANIVTGILFFFGLLINSRKSALYGLYGSILGGLFALLLAFPANLINLGLFGYNAVLCGIALKDKKLKIFLSVTLAILLSVLINFLFEKIGIPALTAPFVLATWAILLIKNRKLNKRFK